MRARVDDHGFVTLVDTLDADTVYIVAERISPMCVGCRRFLEIRDGQPIDGRTKVGTVYNYDHSGAWNLVHNRPCPPIPPMTETVTAADLVEGDKVLLRHNGSTTVLRVDRVRRRLSWGEPTTFVNGRGPFDGDHWRDSATVERYTRAWRREMEGEND